MISHFQGYTALHLAVIQGHESVIASLLDCGTKISFLSSCLMQTTARKPRHKYHVKSPKYLCGNSQKNVLISQEIF